MASMGPVASCLRILLATLRIAVLMTTSGAIEACQTRSPSSNLVRVS